MSNADQSPGLYIGLMSGTSLDSIDAALVDLRNDQVQLIATLEHPIPEALRSQLIELCQPGDNEIDRMGSADKSLGHEFAKAVLSLLEENGTDKADVIAIGCHGQTIRHRPDFDNSFTLQIGDANIISYTTGIDTVADFRRKDMAAGGEGAPLAPAFHESAFGSDSVDRAIVNIGGMANITFLSRSGQTLGFDTGPGNILMDGWIQSIKQRKYDQNGQWASTGTANQSLLNKLLEHPYLSKTPPKSTGREDFCLAWLQQKVSSESLAPEDVQATLLEFTAQTISNEIKNLPAPISEVYICGGGAYNTQLMKRLEFLMKPILVEDTEALGIPAQWVEATAFGWLAKQTLEKKPANMITATGAQQPVILGAIFPA